jgi:hypothetical protein
MSAFWTNILDTYTLHQRQMKWIILGVCCLSVLGGAGIVTWYYVANNSVPDVETANVEKIADYLKSDTFLEKTSLERGEYIEKIMKRYHQMSYEEQQDAQKTMGNVLRKNRKAEKTVVLSFAAKQADAYNKLKTDEEKDQFIDRWLTIMEIGHGGRERARREYQKHNPAGGRRATPEQRRKAIAGLRKNLPLLMSRTTAKDRAKLAKMVRDASQRMQQRYGR